MMTGGDLKKVRRRYADEEAEARRMASKKKRESKRLIDPRKIIERDMRLLNSVINKWKRTEETAVCQIEKMKDVLERAKKAFAFIKNISEEKLCELRQPLAWRRYPELNYVFLMNELF